MKLVAALLAVFSIAYSSRTEAGVIWQTEATDALPGSDSYPHITVDGAGDIHLVYFTTTSGPPYPSSNLRYIVKRSGTWTAQLVGIISGPYYAISPYSFLLDQSGYAHILVRIESGDPDSRVGAYCQYYTNRTGSWTNEILDNETDVSSTSGPAGIAVDSSGNVGVCHSSAIWWPPRFVFARKASGESYWVLENVPTVGHDVWMYARNMAFDRDGNPSFAYYNSPTRTVRVATKQGGAWTLETVTGPSSFSILTSLGAARDGSKHLSYLDRTTGLLHYAVRSASGWVSEVVSGSVSSNGVLQLDAADHPRLTFVKNVGGVRSIVYAEKASGSWHYSTVADVSGTPSLSIDLDGSPHVAWSDGQTRHAWARLEYDQELAKNAAPLIAPSLTVFPTPSHDGRVQIQYTLPGGARSELRIFDAAGRSVSAVPSAIGTGAIQSATGAASTEMAIPSPRGSTSCASKAPLATRPAGSFS